MFALKIKIFGIDILLDSFLIVEEEMQSDGDIAPQIDAENVLDRTCEKQGSSQENAEMVRHLC